MIHLTEDQLDDLLIGDAASDTTAHLATCSDCAARLTAMQQSIASFSAASLAWGERRSATLPLQLQSAPAGLFGSLRTRVALGAATAAVITLALAFPILHHGTATGTAQQAVPHEISAETAQASASLPAAVPVANVTTSDQQQIDRDNQLLQNIDRELAASETPADLVRMAGQQDSNQSSPDVTHNE